MPTLPSSLALGTIVDGSAMVASDERNNFTAIQAAVNALIAAFSGGSQGQLIQALTANSIGYVASTIQVADTTLVAPAASIVFSSIPVIYAHLQLHIYARYDQAGTGSIWLRFNGDTGTNYDFQVSQVSGTTAGGSEGFAQSVIDVGFVPGTGATANSFSQTTVDLAHYAGTANNKDLFSRNAMKQATTTGTLFVRQTAGFWRSNAAISSITILPSAGSFVAGTRATLYAFG